jgi:5-hydroxyisourate hydrolase
MSPITTHVLDTARGRPAAGIAATLEHLVDGLWTTLGRGETNADGRIRDLMPDGSSLEPGIYRLTFETAAYFRALGIEGFYPYVPIVFELAAPEQHYHVPLLLSPYGYSTYRGS